MPEEILRTFIAVELDRPLQAALKKVQDKLQRDMPPRGVRWIQQDSLHLTIKFLGDTPRRRAPEIEAALQAAVTGFAPFEFTVEGRGCFPNFRRPRIVWVAVGDKGQNLQRLARAVERYVAPLGWPAEERAFSPHLTIGRVGRSVSAYDEVLVGKAVEQSEVEMIGRQRVTGISLMQSDLRPTGAVYDRMLFVPFQDGVGSTGELSDPSGG